MMSENTTIEKKPKNPKRVAAGKKGVEARKLKAELRRKEMETMKKENIKLKEAPITKDNNELINITKDEEVQHINIYKNYLPLCLIGVVGLGIYFYKQQQTIIQPVTQTVAPIIKNKEEIDPFEFK